MFGDDYSGLPHMEFVHSHAWWHGCKPERIAVVYLLGILRVTREHIQEIIDFENDQIKPECLKKAWQTALSRRTIMLAFNLYCYWMPSEYPEDCSPSALFDDEKIRKFMLKAIELNYKK